MMLRALSIPLLGIFVCAVGLHAQTNLISNGDFETGASAAISLENPGGYYTPTGAIPTSWKSIAYGSVGDSIGSGSYGYYNPSESSDGNYAVSPTSPTVGTMSGPDVFYAEGVSVGAGLYQATSTTLSTGTDLDLTVALGMRSGENPMGNLRIQIVAVDSSDNILGVLATQVSTSTAAAGSFADATLNYSYTAANSSYLGDTIAVELIKATGGGSDLDFDNVRLESVPEPHTYALLAGVGVLGAVLMNRRRLRST